MVRLRLPPYNMCFPTPLWEALHLLPHQARVPDGNAHL